MAESTPQKLAALTSFDSSVCQESDLPSLLSPSGRHSGQQSCVKSSSSAPRYVPPHARAHRTQVALAKQVGWMSSQNSAHLFKEAIEGTRCTQGPKSTPEGELEKEARKLHKALRHISDLEAKIAEGAELNEQQLQKLKQKRKYEQRLAEIAAGSDASAVQRSSPKQEIENQEVEQHTATDEEGHRAMDALLREAFLEAVAKSWRGDQHRQISPYQEEVDNFLKENGLEGWDERRALQDCSPQAQRAVMSRGDLKDARNPAATLLARIRNEEGLRFYTPVKGSAIYVLHMRPCRPEGTSLEVKNSSFKSLRNFFKSLEAEGILSLAPESTDPIVTQIHDVHPVLRAVLPQRQSPEPPRGQPKAPGASRGRLALLSHSLGAMRPSWSRKGASTPSTKDGSSDQACSDDKQTPSSVQSVCSCHSSASFHTQGEADELLEPCELQVVAETTGDEAPQHAASAEAPCEKSVPVGDFVANTTWNSDEQWEGGELALSVSKGEFLHVTHVDVQGWALAAGSCGSGWLPAAALVRRVYMATSAFVGSAGYAQVQQGDRLMVFHREGEWVYGARMSEHASVAYHGSGAWTCDDDYTKHEIERGWFPTSLVADEGAPSLEELRR
eukprot:TRINITY_DN36141_c0_g1_i1.p1 TRINITY_DN36141_c0_g1~~TRINITY_DN36141_c0_g1_i1.p1  ORF type:complete len:625 (+),score=103.95 TRINITY_DN36141_c0_g1_i1:32-1876(+)